MTLSRANLLVPDGKVYFTVVDVGKVTVAFRVGAAASVVQAPVRVSEVSTTKSVALCLSR